MIKLPGLIDVHVHLRDPGQTRKEDFFTGTSAALAGGFTTVLDMPNNKEPVTTFERLKEKIQKAKKKTVCDIGFYAGTVGNDLDQLDLMASLVFGLKLYFNQTTGNFIIDKKNLKKIFLSWKSNKPILVHAEEDMLPSVLKMIRDTGKRLHVCHISNKKQLNLILKAKKNRLPVTCGVAPHYLFLIKNDIKNLGSFAMMKPPLGTKSDQDFLWENIKHIDIIESDHAPHTIEEKKSDKPPFGVPGLETTLPLLLTAVSEKKLTLKKLIELCFENPKKIFNMKTDKNTWVEIDEKEEYIIDNKNLKTKCGWSPFAGRKVKGKIKRVFIRGKKVYDDGKILVKPGSGKILIH